MNKSVNRNSSNFVIQNSQTNGNHKSKTVTRDRTMEPYLSEEQH